jgi:UbiD family decarboxylase
LEVSSDQAPVHEMVWTGAQADFGRLPIHLQHAEDGGPYVSASIDIATSIDKKRRNVGMRRMMLRGRKEAGIDLVGPSDLRAIYAAYVEHKERMPVAFVVGSHPVDSVAAIQADPEPDELAIMGALRGSPVPLVRCATIDQMVPADAEVVLEGYLDERGWAEYEGPYGEFLGYYGMLKSNPVFHLTAITMRRDALFQTVTIGGRHLGWTDDAYLAGVRTETTAWAALETAVRDPIAIFCPLVRYVCRVSIRQRYPGEAKNAIAAIMGSSADVKSIFVVDEDVDIFSEDQMTWALGTRFQADRDLIVASGFRAQPLDPSLDGSRLGAKAGFDLTIPFGKAKEQKWQVPEPPVLGPSKNQTVREALAAGPKTFRDLMEATGTRDGRDILSELDKLRAEGVLERRSDGLYNLKTS